MTNNNLKIVYFDNVNLYNLISYELETTYNLKLDIKQLKEISLKYIDYCNTNKPITLYDFIKLLVKSEVIM